jgi:hypothetical protein
VTLRVAVWVTPLVPEIVTVVVLETVWVVTVKVVDVLPAGTVTLEGTVATEVRLLESVTTEPPVGAGPERVTVPVEGVLPLTVVGLSVKELSVGEFTASVAVFAAPPYVPVIVADVFDATASVVIVKVAVVAFAGTVTLPGTLAAFVLLLVSVTTAPPDGAGPVSVTVPVEEVPPTTDVGFTVTVLTLAVVTDRLAIRLTPYVPMIAGLALADTGLVVTVNVAVVAFGGTVTLAGTCATEVLLLLNVTIEPPAGAGPVIVTVAVDELPPMTEVGFNASEVSVGAATPKEAVLVPLYVPEIVTLVLPETGFVVMAKVAVVPFAGTVTLAGTCAAPVLLLDKVTNAPPAGAGPFSTTVPVDGLLPVTEVGFTVTVLSTAAITISEPDFVGP